MSDTGRLKQLAPQLQNIPIHSELGKEIRKGFLTAPFPNVDYSALEQRILEKMKHG